MSERIVTVRTYVIVFVALLILAALTTAVAYVDLGIFNTVVAMAIAAAKMTLVALFFMNVRYKRGLTRIVILASFFWLALLVGMTLVDEFSRHWTPQPLGWGPGI
jgi:cytochrome c oxidase subunit 4